MSGLPADSGNVFPLWAVQTFDLSGLFRYGEKTSGIDWKSQPETISDGFSGRIGLSGVSDGDFRSRDVDGDRFFPAGGSTSLCGQRTGMGKYHRCERQAPKLP